MLTVIVYRSGDDPAMILNAAIRSDPDMNYMLVPTDLAKRWKVRAQEPEPISWDAPGGERDATGRCCGVVEGLKVYQK